MLASVSTFLSGIIDDAGLFPPAQLAMAAALDRFLRHRRGPDGWTLSRFVCPIPRLRELAPLLGRLAPDEPPVALALVGRGGQDPAALRAGLERDLEAVDRLLAPCADRVVVQQLEVRLPDQADRGELAEAVAAFVARIEALDQPLAPFFEPSLLQDWHAALPGAVDAVAGVRAGLVPAGLKIRCGGAEASAVPSAEPIAAAICRCRDSEVPLKATEGLHHPVRHLDRQLGAVAHGFVNLFAAAMLARVRRLPEEQVVAVLKDEDPAAFSFSEHGLAWRGESLTVGEIADCRRTAVTSFGSSSLEEPRDGLRRIGLLEGRW